MDVIIGSLLLLGGIVLALVLLARAYPGSGADLVDWKPTRSYEDEAKLEQEDIAQMIEAQNEYRRKRGAPEIGVGDAERMAMEDEQVRERASGSFDDAAARADRQAGGTGPADEGRAD